LEYTTLKLLPYGTLVFGSRVVSNWTLVDLQGDGAADGFVHRHYLEPASATQPALTLT
jgi:hypothetical protein